MQLAVVVASIIQHKSALGLGNVVGSSISNILGAFSLGLLFHQGPMVFDKSAKIYTSVLFGFTTIFTAVALTSNLNRFTGFLFLAAFVVYVISIGYGIYKGVLDAPEDSDSDSDSDSDTSEDDEGDRPTPLRDIEASPFLQNDANAINEPSTSTPAPKPQKSTPPRRPRHSLPYHFTRLFFGFLTLSLSGYILSHSASSLADSFNLSGTVLGITILSFATTLPEKFLSVMSGLRGHGGIVVAGTVGSNIFLLTLCLGVIFVTVGEGRGKIGGGGVDRLGDTLVAFEIWMAWASSAIFMAIVWFGGQRWMGAALLVGYFVFIGLEFTIFRR